MTCDSSIAAAVFDSVPFGSSSVAPPPQINLLTKSLLFSEVSMQKHIPCPLTYVSSEPFLNSCDGALRLVFSEDGFELC